MKRTPITITIQVDVHNPNNGTPAAVRDRIWKAIGEFAVKDNYIGKQTFHSGGVELYSCFVHKPKLEGEK